MSNRDNSDPAPLPRLKRHRVATAILCATLALLFIGGFAFGRRAARLDRYVGLVPSEQAARFRVLWEAWDLLQQQFYRPAALDYRAMIYGCVRGMLASLGDPHTVFLEPAEQRLDADRYNGTFGGIGVMLAMQAGRPTIVALGDESPAAQAGLHAGDVVLAVDGAQVGSLDLSMIDALMRGEAGSTVELTIEREQNGILSFALVRARVELPSVAWRLLHSAIGYVQITYFSARTGAELATSLREMQTRDVRSLVLDLRGNPGGLLDSALEVLGCFLDYGIVLREVNASGAEKRYGLPADSQSVGWPLAVLVDSGTVSAAEMVAAALQERGRGKLIGERTFGKGSVQAVFTLHDGSSVHVTTTHWLSPDGHPIDGLGVEPDIPIASNRGAGAEDLVLQRAADYLTRNALATPSAE